MRTFSIDPRTGLTPRRLRWMADGDQSEEQGGGGGGGRDRDPDESFKSRLGKLNGDGVAFAAELYRENYGYREEKRGLEREIKNLRARVPEGAVILHGDALAEYRAYQELGKPDDWKKDRTERDSLKGEKAQGERQRQIDAVASALNYRRDVLKLALGDAEFSVTGEGKDTVVTVKDGGKDKPLKTWLEESRKDFIDLLPAGQGGSHGGGNGSGGTGPNFTGHGAGDRGGGGAARSYLESVYGGPPKANKE